MAEDFMSPHPAHSKIRIRNRGARRLASAAKAIALGALAGCSTAEANAPSKTRVVYGEAQKIGNGTARVFATLDADKQPTSIGVSLSEAAMTNLPMTPVPPSPSALTLTLAIPTEAKVTGFDHVMLDWNPSGHEPDHVYTLPHFDFHFYTATQAEQMAIMPNAPDFEQRASRLPDTQFAPAGYVAANVLMNAPAAVATVPMMGLHWIDGAATELHGQAFTTTFLWGSFDGRFIFLEPMITKAHIESTKNIAGNSILTALKMPAKYDRPGYYPDRYTIRWDAAAKEYLISLDGLKQQK
jgi:hypothetical protein